MVPPVPTFHFELTGSPRTSPTKTSSNLLTQQSFASAEEISVRNTGTENGLSNTTDTSRNYSLPSSDQTSTPSTKISQVSPTRTSHNSISSSSTQISPVKKNQSHPAFQPYINKPSIFPSNILPLCQQTMLVSPYPTYSSAIIPIQTADECAAHLETVVSNLGKSKHGHICAYCGKLYSRKYGLKIHLRYVILI